MEKSFILSKVLSFEASVYEGLNVTNFTNEEKEIIRSFFVKFFKPWYKENKNVVSARRSHRIKSIEDITFHDCFIYVNLSQPSTETIHDYIHAAGLKLISNKFSEYGEEEIFFYKQAFLRVLPKKE